MKIPFLVGGAVIVAVIAATAYLELRPAPAPPPPAIVAVPPPPPAAPAAPVTPPAPVAECLLPGPPPVPPDGGAASAADMKLGHDTLQAFVLQLEAYQTCNEKLISKAGPDVTDKQKDAWRNQGNAAVDAANALAAAFGRQLKIYHTKHPEALANTPTK